MTADSASADNPKSLTKVFKIMSTLKRISPLTLTNSHACIYIQILPTPSTCTKHAWENLKTLTLCHPRQMWNESRSPKSSLKLLTHKGVNQHLRYVRQVQQRPRVICSNSHLAFIYGNSAQALGALFCFRFLKLLSSMEVYKQGTVFLTFSEDKKRTTHQSYCINNV